MDEQIRDAKVSKEKIICEKFAVFKDCVYLCTAFPKKMHLGSGFSAVGSAHVWGARGRWFESSNPDQSKEDEFSLILFFIDSSSYQLMEIATSCSPASRAAFISLPPPSTLQRLMSSPSTASIFNLPSCDFASRPATVLRV